MKNIIKIGSLLLIAISIFSCRPEEIDIAGLTDFPPGILSVSPANNSKVVKGDFDVVVKFVDGTTSPLANAILILKDPAGTQLAKADQNISGTADSLVIKGSTFNAANLAIAKGYTIEITVTDVNQKTQTSKVTFEISALPFAANQDEMFLAGSFNGWGADRLTLIADNTWEIKGILMDGGEWKLKNCADWCKDDWGDSDGDGIVELTTGGGANSASSPSGLVNFTWNDQTLRYTITPAVIYATNIKSLYLLGSFNNYEGSDYKFNLVADNTWVLDQIQLKPTDKFKFSEGPFFMGRNWGDNEHDGKADEFGTNISLANLPSNQGEAFYKLTFNDKTLVYTIEFIRFPSIGIIGSATPGGWDSDTDLTDNGDGTFSLLISLTDGEAKFRANDSWDTNWGAADFPSGIATQNGPNIPVIAGLYKVTFNPGTGEYNFVPGIGSVGIIGSATPGGWDSDTDLADNGDGSYSIVIGLGDGEAKFRTNNAWDDNWGAGDFPSGIGTKNGPNIPVTAGIYVVTFNPSTGAYSFAPASIGIIGSATPGGWDSDTNMTPNASEIGVVTLTIDLVNGEAKFRANDGWGWNWGAADFPSGTAVANGPNIPVTAGTYTVKFNVNTGAYSFQ